MCRGWNVSVSVGVNISFTGRGFALKLCLTAESNSEHRNKKVISHSCDRLERVFPSPPEWVPYSPVPR